MKSEIPSLLLLLLLLTLSNKQVVQSQLAADSTSFEFSSFSPDLSDLTYQGDASGLGYVYLTQMNGASIALPNSAGRIVYSPPVAFWQPGRQASFTTSIDFNMRGGNSNVQGNEADGLTFFIIPVNSRIPRGSSGGNFGIFDPKTGFAPSTFAVELDIFSNEGWDPSYTHMGININSRASVAVAPLNYPFNQGATATINYDSPTRMITVIVYYGTMNYTLSYEFDLKTILPQQVHVGVSASTGQGEATAIHRLSYWSFTSGLVWDDPHKANNIY